MADGLAHYEDKGCNGACGGIHQSKASLGYGHVRDQKWVLEEGGMACDAGQEKVDHGLDSHQQWAYPVIPPFVVALGEAVHDFRAHEVGELV